MKALNSGLEEKIRQGAQALERIKNNPYDKVIIAVHRHADVDSLASALAVANLLCDGVNPPCTIVVPQGLSLAGKEFMKRAGHDPSILTYITNVDAALSLVLERDKTAIIVVDAASVKHLEPISRAILGRGIDLLLDHHAYNELVGISNTPIVDKRFSSTSEIVTLITAQTGAQLDEGIYCMLQAGILTDTSRFARAGPLTFEAMAYLTRSCPYQRALDLIEQQKRQRSDTIALLKALQRMQIHTGRYIVAGTFVGSNEAQVLGLLMGLGVDAGFALSIQKDHVRITYRISDKSPQEVVDLLHESIKKSLRELEGPQGHARAGVYVWFARASKREMPSIVKRVLEQFSRMEEGKSLG